MHPNITNALLSVMTRQSRRVDTEAEVNGALWAFSVYRTGENMIQAHGIQKTPAAVTVTVAETNNEKREKTDAKAKGKRA